MEGSEFCFIKTEEDSKKEDVSTQDTKTIEGAPSIELVKAERSVLIKFTSWGLVFFA
jgi:hypothetical protein